MTQLTLIEEFVNSGIGWNRKNKKTSLNSKKNYRNHLQQFGLFLKKREKTINTVDDEDVTEYLADMKRHGYQDNTISVKIAALRSYFKWMKHKGAIAHYPTINPQPHYPTAHKKVPDEVLASLFQKISGDSFKEIRDTAMIALIVFCGFKTEEVVALNISALDLMNQQVKGRPMNGTLALLTRYISKRGTTKSTDPLFVNKHQKRITARSLRRNLFKYFQNLNLETIYSTRDLQYTFQCKQKEAINQS